MNTVLGKNAKHYFEKDIFKLLNKGAFEKKNYGESKRKHRDIQLLTTKARRNYLMSEPNYHKNNVFWKIH